MIIVSSVKPYLDYLTCAVSCQGDRSSLEMTLRSSNTNPEAYEHLMFLILRNAFSLVLYFTLARHHHDHNIDKAQVFK